jgi:hypothetical protein
VKETKNYKRGEISLFLSFPPSSHFSQPHFLRATTTTTYLLPLAMSQSGGKSTGQGKKKGEGNKSAGEFFSSLITSLSYAISHMHSS